MDPTVWGATAEETTARYPCDDHAPAHAESLFRAVTVHAPRERVYRWLCQLKVAPYSYDLLDNGGRRSPRTLTPGADELARGDRILIFTLVDFAPGEHLTLRLTDPRALAVFGPLTITYAIRDGGPDTVRLVVKLLLGRRGDGALDAVRRRALIWGDLLMMRKQLHNLRDLAETAVQRSTS